MEHSNVSSDAAAAAVSTEHSGEADSTTICSESSSSVWTTAGAESQSGHDSVEGRPLSDVTYLVIGIYLTIAWAISLLGNLVLLTRLLQKRIWKSSNFNRFVLNIVIASLVESFCGFPLVVVSSFKGRWLFGELGCVYYAFIVYTCALVIVTCYLLVSVYRYRVVVTQVPANSGDTRHWIHCCLVGAWTYALCWSVCPFLGFGRYSLEPYSTACSLDWVSPSPSGKVYNLLVFVFVFYFPIGAMSWCYLAVVKRLKNQVGPSVNQSQSGNGSTSNTTTTANLRISTSSSEEGLLQAQSIKIILVSMVTFVVIWSPYALLSMMATFNVHIHPAVSVLPTLMAKTHPAVNPLIYFVSYRHYRLSFHQLFGAVEPV